MRLSDIMSKMGLASYAEVALVIFLIAFVAIVIKLVFFSKKSEIDHASRLPLEGDDPPQRHDSSDRGDARRDKNPHGDGGSFRRQGASYTDYS